MFRPSWFDAAVQYQPAEPPKAEKSNVKPLEYPEDRLLATLAKRHPELWSNTIINMVPDEMGHVNYTHPASAFVERQKYWISKGQTEEEAYRSVLADWNRQRRFERIELQLAMLQASERGVELRTTTSWEDRRNEEFEAALNRRLNLDQQKRRERLEALLEARDADRETQPVDLASLDPDITQADLEALLENDSRAQEHFGGDASSFSLEIERLLPRPGDPEFQGFRDFVDERLSDEQRQLLLDNIPDQRRAQYFRMLDEKMEQLRREERQAVPVTSGGFGGGVDPDPASATGSASASGSGGANTKKGKNAGAAGGGKKGGVAKAQQGKKMTKKKQ